MKNYAGGALYICSIVFGIACGGNSWRKQDLDTDFRESSPYIAIFTAVYNRDTGHRGRGTPDKRMIPDERKHIVSDKIQHLSWILFFNREVLI